MKLFTSAKLSGLFRTFPHCGAIGFCTAACLGGACLCAAVLLPLNRTAAQTPTREELKKKLTPLQYKVTQEDATEPSFRNEYWDNHTPGIYVDVVSGKPLFSSTDKYDSGTGWPSFTQPIDKSAVTEREDNTLFSTRTEVRSASSDSHLGHVFDDGPQPTGQRYCMNSAALRFVPAADLAKQGYGELAKLFPGVAVSAPLGSAVVNEGQASAPQAGSGPQAAASGTTAAAIFAGGCFWCMEPPFEKLPGVTAVISGYTGGTLANPTYEQVSAGGTGHYEAVKVEYDPSKVSYQQLLDVYWKNVDPLDAEGQFCDKGDSYKSAIFTAPDQKSVAQTSLAAQAATARFAGKQLATQVIDASAFYPAEDYHQDYYKKNPIRYKFYRTSCKRDARLAEVWGE